MKTLKRVRRIVLGLRSAAQAGCCSTHAENSQVDVEGTGAKDAVIPSSDDLVNRAMDRVTLEGAEAFPHATRAFITS